MKFGLKDSDYELLKKLVIDPLKKQSAKVYIFGSRVTGQNHPFSDIDVLIELPFDKKLPAGFLSSIKEDAEESKLSCKVDMVKMEDLAESYRESVMRSRVEV